VMLAKHDDVIWAKHLQESGMRLSLSTSIAVLINGVQAVLLPMRPGRDGRATHGWRVEGQASPVWRALRRGESYELTLVESVGSEREPGPSRAPSSGAQTTTTEEQETVGIDLSSKPKRTALCRVRWEAGRAVVQAPQLNVTDQELASVLAGSAFIAIDVPFGWPTRFVDMIAAHQEMRWPEGLVIDQTMFLRVTDIEVRRQLGIVPLSVAADRICRPAVRAAALLAKHPRSSNWDRSGTVGSPIEVYPRAALARWVGPHRYKDDPAGLVALAKKLFDREWLVFEVGARRQYEVNEDAFDALVASFVARAHQCGLVDLIPPESLPIARREGWIWVPREETLDSLPRTPGNTVA
jgi:hypothetical protein